MLANKTNKPTEYTFLIGNVGNNTKKEKKKKSSGWNYLKPVLLDDLSFNLQDKKKKDKKDILVWLQKYLQKVKCSCTATNPLGTVFPQK